MAIRPRSPERAPIASAAPERRLQLVGQPPERVYVRDGCGVVLVDRAPDARCSRSCRKRAEWSRVVAREATRKAARLAQVAELVRASADPARGLDEPFWCWRIRAALARGRTGEAADLWARAVELVRDRTIPTELALAADELGWAVPARWTR
ncbi:hypothetical protein [Cellulomonas persica]|uniref:Uncharacterized protein n=1 Tax=Cellulomonas persica TaxID=76861 RepID=A0A510UQC2_9CELL|nr:hypothetical protein [Cellulomonas persica]GEK16867.1 hypothetical protein CPE01_06000 [Cellulomonas persica]